MVKRISFLVFGVLMGTALLYLIFVGKTDTNAVEPNVVSSRSAAEEASPTSLPEKLASSDQAVRRKAGVELSKLQHRKRITSQKLLYELYLAIISADEDPDFVGQGCEILSRSPRSEKIVAHAKHLIEDDQHQTRVAGALVYLRKHGPSAFARYFDGKKYGDLSLEVRRELAGWAPVSKLYVQHVSQIVDDYVKWQPPPHSPNAANPHREAVVAAGKEAALLLIKSQTNVPVSPAVARALGEIGVPESFTYLLDQYKKTPRVDIGIAVGSSWRSLYVEKAFSSLDEITLRNLLETVLDKRWERIKDQSLTDVKKHILDNLVEIIVECRKRSKPVLEQTVDGVSGDDRGVSK